MLTSLWLAQVVVAVVHNTGWWWWRLWFEPTGPASRITKSSFTLVLVELTKTNNDAGADGGRITTTNSLFARSGSGGGGGGGGGGKDGGPAASSSGGGGGSGVNPGLMIPMVPGGIGLELHTLDQHQGFSNRIWMVVMVQGHGPL